MCTPNYATWSTPALEDELAFINALAIRWRSAYSWDREQIIAALAIRPDRRSSSKKAKDH